MLEQGRAILWSRMQGYRHRLDQLREVDRELADRLDMLSGQLERLAMSSEPELVASSTGPGTAGIESRVLFEAKMKRHRILSDEWAGVLGNIRKVDGFTNFLRAVPFAKAFER